MSDPSFFLYLILAFAAGGVFVALLRPRREPGGPEHRSVPPTTSVPIPQASPPPVELASSDPSKRYTVVLEHAGPKLILVIKEIRALTGLGLRDAKNLVEHPPSTVLSGVGPDTAETARRTLADAGARVRLTEER